MKAIYDHSPACVYCEHGPRCRDCVLRVAPGDPMYWPVCEPHGREHRELLASGVYTAGRMEEDDPEPEIGSRRIDRHHRVWVRTYVPRRDGVHVMWACWDPDAPSGHNPVCATWENLLRWLA